MQGLKTISQLFEKFLSESDNDKVLIGNVRCVLSDFFQIQGCINKIFIHKKIVYLRLTSSSLRHSITLKKNEIINRCHDKKLLIDDIIVF